MILRADVESSFISLAALASLTTTTVKRRRLHTWRGDHRARQRVESFSEILPLEFNFTHTNAYAYAAFLPMSEGGSAHGAGDFSSLDCSVLQDVFLLVFSLVDGNLRHICSSGS